MTTIHTTTGEVLPVYDICPECGADLPQGAVFCASCGKRLDKVKDLAALLQDEPDMAARYRITSLARRLPYVDLFLALDNQPSVRGRMVTMRDIDLTPLEDEQARLSAIELVQQEYDLLRHWQLPNVIPAIDLHYARGHLFTVAAFAPQSSAAASAGSRGRWPRLTTLQDYLQSGQGLPSERRSLQIINMLCEAVKSLHNHQLIIGDLDPHTVILNGETADAQPALTISWLLPQVRAMLPQPDSAAALSYFTAPEALRGNADARSDIYSLGAIFYLLLTGMPPEESTLRHRNRLRTPQEVHGRIAMNVSESVMQCLTLEPGERFQNVAALSEALRNARYRRPTSWPESEASKDRIPDVETVRIVPLSQKDVARWQAGRPSEQTQVAAKLPIQARPETPPETSPVIKSDERWGEKVDVPREEKPRRRERQEYRPPAPPAPPDQPARSWMNRVTSVLPAINLDTFKSKRVPSTAPAPQQVANALPAASQGANSWFEQLKRIVLGKQRHAIAAAAIIETPLRVLPDQMYTIRLHVMGRDHAVPPSEARGGLSVLTHGNVALIEVRSVLHQSYAYILQQATVTVPGEGYVAEVTIPMQPLASSQTGRRDRFHIFFLNDQRQPLYEKPFVLEIFVSHHVKRGNEGHHVLTIPV